MRAEQSYFRVGELLLLTPAEINTRVGGPIDISSVCMTGAEFDGSRPPRTRGVRIGNQAKSGTQLGFEPPKGAGKWTPRLITVQAAADRLAVSRWMVYRLIWDQQVKSVQIGRCRRIVRQSFEDYLAGLIEGAA